MREKVAEMDFDLAYCREGPEIGLLTLRLIRIMRARAYLSGKIAQLVHPVSRQ